MRLNDLALGTLSLIFGVIVMGYAATFPSIPGQDYGPGLFPILIGAGMAITGLSLVVAGIGSRQAAPPFEILEWQRSRPVVINAVLLIAATVFYMVAVDELGFILTCFAVLGVALVRLHGHPLLSIAIAAIAAPALQYIFADLLLVPLPWGVLQPIAW